MSVVYGPYTNWDSTMEWTTETGRYIIPATEISASGSKVKVKLGYYASDWAFAKMYIGHQAAAGDVYDFDGSPVQLLFSGNPNGTVSTGGLISDTATFALDETKALIVSFYISGAAVATPLRSDATGYGIYYKAGDDAATVDATGYSASGHTGERGFVEQIETIDVTADITDTATMTDTMEGDSWTRSITDTATMTDTMEALLLVSEMTDTATLTDTMSGESTFYRSISDTATMTDSMEALHLVESITDTATMTDYMVGTVNDEVRRRRVKVNW